MNHQNHVASLRHAAGSSATIISRLVHFTSPYTFLLYSWLLNLFYNIISSVVNLLTFITLMFKYGMSYIFNGTYFDLCLVVYILYAYVMLRGRFKTQPPAVTGGLFCSNKRNHWRPAGDRRLSFEAAPKCFLYHLGGERQLSPRTQRVVETAWLELPINHESCSLPIPCHTRPSCRSPTTCFRLRRAKRT